MQRLKAAPLLGPYAGDTFRWDRTLYPGKEIPEELRLLHLIHRAKGKSFMAGHGIVQGTGWYGHAA